MAGKQSPKTAPRRPLTPAHRELIELLARIAVREYLEQSAREAEQRNNNDIADEKAASQGQGT